MPTYAIWNGSPFFSVEPNPFDPNGGMVRTPRLTGQLVIVRDKFDDGVSWVEFHDGFTPAHSDDQLQILTHIKVGVEVKFTRVECGKFLPACECQGPIIGIGEGRKFGLVLVQAEPYYAFWVPIMDTIPV